MKIVAELALKEAVRALGFLFLAQLQAVARNFRSP